jgi:hypothetical protein
MNLLDNGSYQDFDGSSIILNSSDHESISLEVLKNIPFEGILYLVGYSRNGNSQAFVPIYVKVCGDEYVNVDSSKALS